MIDRSMITYYAGTISEDVLFKHIEEMEKDGLAKGKGVLYSEYLRYIRCREDILQLSLLLNTKDEAVKKNAINVLYHDFNNYLIKESKKNIKLKINHIIIPTLKYFGHDQIHIRRVSTHVYKNGLFEEIGYEKSFERTYTTLCSGTMSYYFANKIDLINKEYPYDSGMPIKINFSKEEAIEELDTYSELYGDELVEKVKDHVKDLEIRKK